MRKQQKVWEIEHTDNKTIPGMASVEPSESVIMFVKFLKQQSIGKELRVVDIGCGKGRNAVYFAEQGFFVYALDYVQEAINSAKKLASERGLSDHIQFIVAALDKEWPFKPNYFDVAVDCYTSIDIETRKGREIYKSELFRTLKSGGYALVTAPSIKDELEQELRRTHPGKEKNSTIWPNGKFQKDYDEKELRVFYKDFEIIDLKEVSKPAYKLGQHYIATNYWMILQKQ